MDSLRIRSMILSLTDACNLRCRYCYVPKDTHKMSYDVAEKSVDMLAEIHRKYYPDKDPSYVSFFGGEPTLYWDELVYPLIMHYKESGELNKDIRFNLMTNGILLNEERIDFLRDNDISVICSVDGGALTQNYNRPFADNVTGSFDAIQKNLQYLTDNTRTSCRGTLIPETCTNLYSDIQFLSKYKFQQIMYMPDWSNIGWTEEVLNKLKIELRKYSLYFINTFKQGKYPLELSNITDYFEMLPEYFNSVNSAEPLCRQCNACGLGETAVGINYNGDIYACQELQSALSREDIYCIGNIYSGVDIKKHAALKELFMCGSNSCEGNTDKCNTCLYKPLCNRYTCHASHYMRCRDMNKKSRVECAWDEMNLNEALYISNALIHSECESYINKYIKR